MQPTALVLFNHSALHDQPLETRAKNSNAMTVALPTILMKPCAFPCLLDNVLRLYGSCPEANAITQWVGRGESFHELTSATYIQREYAREGDANARLSSVSRVLGAHGQVLRVCRSVPSLARHKNENKPSLQPTNCSQGRLLACFIALSVVAEFAIR